MKRVNFAYEMEIIELEKNVVSKEPKTLTIGFFDGVHKGHKYIISEVVNKSENDNTKSACLTFDCHPKSIVSPQHCPKLLTTNSEKTKLLSETGLDYYAIIKFDKSIADVSAEMFIKNYLKEKLNVVHLIIGYDHRFGKNSEESFTDYVKYGEKYGVKVTNFNSIPYKYTYNGKPKNISSTVIRTELEEGNVETANAMLGYRYSITGTVEKGFQLGNNIGFPTANIQPNSKEKLIPSNGVYAVKVKVQSSCYDGMLYIGNRPTVNSGEKSIEVNMFDFNKNIYGETITIEFVKFVRSESKFDSIDQLKQQLYLDRNMVKAILR